MEQVSQSVVRVSVAEPQCEALRYHIVAASKGGSTTTNTNSTTSVVDVSGLDLCQYSYSFVGSVVTTGGFQSDLSSPVDFSTNLSGKNILLPSTEQ